MDGTTGVEERARIKARLKALLAKTVENGCTEAEAMAAAQKAADLMAEHDLTYETVEDVKAERYSARTRPMNGGLPRKNPHEARLVAPRIGGLFSCRGWSKAERGENMIVFFGTEADTEAAHQLYAIVRMAMEAELAAYLRSPGRRDRRRHGQRIRTDFMSQMAVRLDERLEDIATSREAACRKVAEETGRALVLVTKEQEVTARYAAYVAETGVQLRARSGRSTVRSGTAAAAAGQAAGDRVDLGGAKIATGTKRIGQVPEVR